jgi:hypothetical protein
MMNNLVRQMFFNLSIGNLINNGDHYVKQSGNQRKSNGGADTQHVKQERKFPFVIVADDIMNILIAEHR